MANLDDGIRLGWVSRWLQSHARAFFYTLGTLTRNPLSSFLTALVIGVTLALPAGFHLVVRNAAALSHSWESASKASLFLKDEVDVARGKTLARELLKRADISATQYLSREESLAEFKAASGYGEALDALASNPLPAVLIVTPKPGLAAATVKQLVGELGKLPEVEAAKLDQEWLERLQALLALAQRAILLIAVVLGLAVVVIVGNTIRLDLEARREEIKVMKLVGAPASFIRRPFLYAGIWYGLVGGLLALILVQIGSQLLGGPARQLLALYGSSYQSSGLSGLAALSLLGCGLLLGLAGAQLTVARHLSSVEPG